MFRFAAIWLLMICPVIVTQAQYNLDSLLNELKPPHSANDKIILYAKTTWSYLTLSEMDLAAKYADSVYITAAASADSVGIMKAHYYYGIIGRFRGDYKNALRHLQTYLSFHEARGDSSRVAGALFQIGVVHSKYGNYEKSLAAHQRCLAIEEAANNAYSIGYTLNSIGIIYKETGALETAITYYNKALIIFDTLQELVDKTGTLVNLGNTYSDMEQFDVAMNYYREAMRIDEQTGKKHGVALSLANIAFLYDKRGNFDSALVYHQRALNIRKDLPYSEDLVRSLIGVGRGYLKLGRAGEAQAYLQRALAMASENHSKPLLRDAHNNLSDMYEQMGNHKRAMYHFRQYDVFKDSILNEQTAERINELQIKHEVADKVKQIALLESEARLQEAEARRQGNFRTMLLAGMALIIALATSIIYVIRQRYLISQKDNQIKEANLRHQLSDLKMQALRAQINPHFLFNCLTSINRMIVKGDNENASLYLKKFARLVRLIVENGEATRVSLEDELALIEAYIQLEELRFKSKIGFEIDIDEKVEKENTFLPPMILQPFVENSIWHGLTNKDNGEQGRIRIAVREDQESLVCMIEDNGVGRERSRALDDVMPGKKRSVGMTITEERLKLLSPERLKDLVRIVDLKDAFDAAIGTRVEIRIPLS